MRVEGEVRAATTLGGWAAAGSMPMVVGRPQTVSVASQGSCTPGFMSSGRASIVPVEGGVGVHPAVMLHRADSDGMPTGWVVVGWCATFGLQSSG